MPEACPTRWILQACLGRQQGYVLTRAVSAIGLCETFLTGMTYQAAYQLYCLSLLVAKFSSCCSTARAKLPTVRIGDATLIGAGSTAGCRSN